MSSTTQSYPGLLSAPRITTLVASLFVALSSGTNYVYSAYAPQLGARLHITHTQLNIVGLAGNVGVYSSGPFWGRIVDTRGPRILLVCAFILLLVGYSGMRYLFDFGLPPSASTISAITFYLLVMCSFLTGAGGNGGLTSSINSTAKTFPDKARGTATGLVISGFGLSAFLFSTISSIAFAGNTSSFLLLLSLGTSFPMIIGFFFVRTVPLPPTEFVDGVEYGVSNSSLGEAGLVSTSGLRRDSESRTRLLHHDDLGETIPQIDLSREYNGCSSGRPLRDPAGGVPAHSQADGLPNIHGRKLWCSTDFWILFTILSMLSGTGLMYINNVGSMSQALYANGSEVYNEVEAAHWQADQVSAISIMNFSGRVFIGLVSDFSKNRLNLPRSYSLVLVSFFFLISQVTAANVDNISHLWMSSSLLGLAHGSVFSLFPTVCIEWFGMPHFSENWGYLSMSPMFAGNLFSVAFGRNLDAHEAAPSKFDLVTRLSPPQCMQGRECYVDTLYLTIGACFLSMVLSTWAGWRDRRKIAAADLSRRAEVIWEDSEQ